VIQILFFSSADSDIRIPPRRPGRYKTSFNLATIVALSLRRRSNSIVPRPTASARLPVTIVTFQPCGEILVIRSFRVVIWVIEAESRIQVVFEAEGYHATKLFSVAKSEAVEKFWVLSD
jgi:hypothetical protein